MVHEVIFIWHSYAVVKNINLRTVPTDYAFLFWEVTGKKMWDSGTGHAHLITYSTVWLCNIYNSGTPLVEELKVPYILSIFAQISCIPVVKINVFPTLYPVLSDLNILYPINFTYVQDWMQVLFN